MPGSEELGLLPATRHLLKKIKDRPLFAFGEVPVTSEQERNRSERAILGLECIMGINDGR